MRRTDPSFPATATLASVFRRPLPARRLVGASRKLELYGQEDTRGDLAP